MWLLLMVRILDSEIVEVARAGERPATCLPEGPASPAQAMALGLLAPAAGIYAEREERFPNFKEYKSSKVYIREGEQQLAKLKHTKITGKLLEAEGGTSLVGDGRARLKAFRALLYIF